MTKPNAAPLAHTLDEAAELARTSRRSLYAEIGAGNLHAIKRGRRTLVLRTEIERWLASLPAAIISAPHDAGNAKAA
jgi:excisionase family DNA binding protein